MKNVNIRLTDQAEQLLVGTLLEAYARHKRQNHEVRANILNNLVNQVQQKVQLYEM